MQKAITDEQAWDQFVLSSREGQFQQSAGWARTKGAKGWNVARDYVVSDGTTLAGFQLLWKRTRLGRIGYVSKGPVVADDAPPEASDLALSRIGTLAARLRLRAVVAQPPDESALTPASLVRRGFFFYPLSAVIYSTAVVKLKQCSSDLIAAMDPNSRRKWRTAGRRGVTFRWAGRLELAQFFEMMCVSAHRQASRPNPATMSELEALWDNMQGHVRLGVAEFEGSIKAGVLCVGFGKRLSIWKVGWTGTDPHLFANCLANCESLAWAGKNGYETADFVAIDPAIAINLLQGFPLSEAQNRSKDKFHLELGAQPMMLPPAQLLVVNQALRAPLRMALRIKWLRDHIFDLANLQ